MISHEATELAKILKGLARFSQCSESRSAFSQAADMIERLVRENRDLLRARSPEGSGKTG